MEVRKATVLFVKECFQLLSIFFINQLSTVTVIKLVSQREIYLLQNFYRIIKIISNNRKVYYNVKRIRVLYIKKKRYSFVFHDVA